jgi:two-component system sensor histidine kinase RegB
VLAREQHLSQLDGLAAAAAHELGTPLATVALVVSEMARLKPPPGPFADDLSLLTQEIGRCRAILGKLASLREDGAGPLGEMTIGQLIEEIVAPHRPFDIAIEVETGGKPSEPICRRNPGMLYGLRNIIENAVDFAKHKVQVHASWSEDQIEITIADDGPGVAPHILARLGEPYITTRGDDGRDHGGGLGLGLFIAKTLLERSGATTSIVNATPPEAGAIATVVWTRSAFEQGRRRPQESLEGYAVAAAK